MSNYLYAELVNNSFTVKTNLTIFENNFKNIPFKLDTGCTYSTIPYHRLKNDDKICSLRKIKDLEDNISYKLSYGVESGGLFHPEPISYEEKLNCPAIKFKHIISNFCLGGYALPDSDIYINYDRHGNILIGMDILSKFDIHIGTSNLSNKVVLLAVLKDQENKSDYVQALNKHFGLVYKESLIAKGLRNIFRI